MRKVKLFESSEKKKQASKFVLKSYTHHHVVF